VPRVYRAFIAYERWLFGLGLGGLVSYYVFIQISLIYFRVLTLYYWVLFLCLWWYWWESVEISLQKSLKKRIKVGSKSIYK